MRRGQQFQALAVYLAERDRGLVHYAEWDELMARERERFASGEPSRFEEERKRYLAMRKGVAS